MSFSTIRKIGPTRLGRSQPTHLPVRWRWGKARCQAQFRYQIPGRRPLRRPGAGVCRRLRASADAESALCFCELAARHRRAQPHESTGANLRRRDMPTSRWPDQLRVHPGNTLTVALQRARYNKIGARPRFPVWIASSANIC